MDLPDYMETLSLLAAEIAIVTDISVDIVCEILLAMLLEMMEHDFDLLEVEFNTKV
jgi:hypothetical protein